MFEKTINMRVRDVTNESFHEHRPSFRSLVAKFDSQKNSMSYEFKKPSIDQLIKQKSIRHQFSTSFSSMNSDMKSLALSAASLNASFASLGLISEDEEEAFLLQDEEELEDDIDEKAEQEMAEILAELDLIADQEEVLPSSPPPDLFVKSMEKAPPSKEEPVERHSKKKKKKRTPKFVTEPFAKNYELGDEVGNMALVLLPTKEYLLSLMLRFFAYSWDPVHLRLFEMENTSKLVKLMQSKS
jgi:DNA replication initiation complex subunit (GINS family)